MRSPRPSRDKALLALILAVGLALRLAYGFLRPPAAPPGQLPNQDNYSVLASNFADTGTLSDNGKPTAEREPVFPIVLGSAYKVFGKSYRTAHVLNSLLGTALLLALYLVGKRLFGPETALLAAAIAAVYPPFLYYCAQPIRETLMALESALCLLALLRAIDSEKPAHWAQAAVVGAVAGLTNTTFLPFCLVAAPVALVLTAGGGTRLGMMVYLPVFILVYALWPVRNRLVFGEWLLGSTAGAGTISYVYQVVPPEAGGTPREVEIVAADPIIQEGSAITDPIAREKFFWRAGMAKARREPLAFLGRFCRRFFIDMWRFYPRPRAYDQPYAALKAVGLLTDGWIIPLAFLGLLYFWRLRPPEAGLVPLFVASCNAAYALILSILRYRVALMPWMILFAALSLTEIYKRMKAKV